MIFDNRNFHSLFTDKEIESLYQHRLINTGDQFPVYIELRTRESKPTEFRQCCLNFMFLNVYFVKLNDNGSPEICMKSTQLDTLKG